MVFVSLWFLVADWVWVDLGWFGLVVGLIFGFGFLAGNVGFVGWCNIHVGWFSVDLRFVWVCYLA